MSTYIYRRDSPNNQTLFNLPFDNPFSRSVSATVPAPALSSSIATIEDRGGKRNADFREIRIFLKDFLELGPVQTRTPRPWGGGDGLEVLNEDRRDAKAKGQHAAAISAVMGKAKLLGLVTEKHEDVTKPDFSKATSLNDVGLKLLQAVGYASPSPADVALALDAHASLIATLEAIAERAQGGRMLD